MALRNVGVLAVRYQKVIPSRKKIKFSLGDTLSACVSKNACVLLGSPRFFRGPPSFPLGVPALFLPGCPVVSGSVVVFAPCLGALHPRVSPSLAAAVAAFAPARLASALALGGVFVGGCGLSPVAVVWSRGGVLRRSLV